MQTLTAMPETFAAGTSFQLSKSYPRHTAADGWAMTLWFAGPSTGSLQGTDAGGGAYTFDVVKSETESLVPGIYRAAVKGVKASTEAEILDYWLVNITPDIATATAGSMLSWEEKALPLVEAAIDDIVAGKLQSYTVPGRGAEKLGLEQLQALRADLVATIRQRRTGRVGRQHAIHFRPAS